MVFSTVLELNGIYSYWKKGKTDIWPYFPLLPNREQSEAATSSFPAGEQQGVNQSWFTKYLCQVFIWFFLLSSPPLPFCKCQPLPEEPSSGEFHTFLFFVKNPGTGLDPIVVSGCLLVKLRVACGKK